MPGAGVSMPVNLSIDATSMAGQQQQPQLPFAAGVQNPNVAALHAASSPSQQQRPSGDSVTPSAVGQSAGTSQGVGDDSGVAVEALQGKDDSPPTEAGAADSTPIAADFAGVFNSSSNSGSSDKPNTDSSPSTD